MTRAKSGSRSARSHDVGLLVDPVSDRRDQEHVDQPRGGSAGAGGGRRPRAVGAGLTNWAFLLPALQELRAAGHPLVLAHHEAGYRGLVAPASPLDLVCASGLAGFTNVRRTYHAAGVSDELVQLMTEATVGVKSVDGPMPAHLGAAPLRLIDVDVLDVQDRRLAGRFGEVSQLATHLARVQPSVRPPPRRAARPLPPRRTSRGGRRQRPVANPSAGVGGRRRARSLWV
jgi:hypothetical protein